MRNGTLITSAALGFLLGATGFAFAQQNARTGSGADKVGDTTQTPKTTDDTTQQKAGDEDKDAIKMMHQANQAEMEMGKLAQSNGTKDVKDYGRMLEQDHNKADKQLQALAKQKQVQLMPKTGDEQKMESKELDQLRNMKGDQFDQAFLQKMVDGHDKKIAALTKMQNEVNDPQVKSLIQETLPTLKHHRDMAQSLLQKHSG
jgi:putative membrane protein